MTCVVQVDVTSSTGNAGAEHALGEALLGGVDRVERSRLIATDPVAVVAAVKALVDRSFAPIGGVAFRFTIRRVELDAHAIELLAEDTEPARAMWTWLWRDGRDLVSPHTAIVGVVAGRSSDDVEEPARALIDAALPSRGESLLVWLRRGTFGQLLRVGHGDRIERVVSRYSRARSSYDFARGWSVTAHGGDAPPETFELAPGTTVEIDTMRFTAL